MQLRLVKNEIYAAEPAKTHSAKKTPIPRKLGAANALRSWDDVNRLKAFMLNKGTPHDLRNYALVVFAINTGRRAGDILKTKVSDLLNPDYSFKEAFYISEQKTGKTAEIYLNDAMREALELYFEDRQPCLNEPLFISRQTNKGTPRPISLKRFNQLLQEAQAELSLKGKISSHTCRKTMGRLMMEGEKNDPFMLAKLQKMYNHDSPQTTLIYLDIQRDEERALHDKYQF